LLHNLYLAVLLFFWCVLSFFLCVVVLVTLWPPRDRVSAGAAKLDERAAFFHPSGISHRTTLLAWPPSFHKSRDRDRSKSDRVVIATTTSLKIVPGLESRVKWRAARAHSRTSSTASSPKKKGKSDAPPEETKSSTWADAFLSLSLGKSATTGRGRVESSSLLELFR
jgi:hypothetical protein